MRWLMMRAYNTSHGLEPLAPMCTRIPCAEVVDLGWCMRGFRILRLAIVLMCRTDWRRAAQAVRSLGNRTIFGFDMPVWDSSQSLR